MTSTLVTGREAARRLAQAGVSERAARRVLAAGLGGPPIRTTAAVLYEAAAVQTLLDRPCWTPESVRDSVVAHWKAEGAAGGEVLVLRRDVRPGSSPDEVRGALARNWRMSWLTALHLGARPLLNERVALIATSGGFVTSGHEVVAVRAVGLDLARLELEPPGSWFDELADAHIPTGPGREWVVLGAGWASRPCSVGPRVEA